MGKPKSIAVGMQFGKLTVTGVGLGIRRPGNYRSATSTCVCTCGGTADVGNSCLKNGDTKSCGCSFKDRGGLSRLPEYFIWKKMISRCHNPSDPGFNGYGARGIQVCAKWRESLSDFLTDIGTRPSMDHSLDRINNDGNYEPGNIRWATRTEQQNNRRCNRRITFNKQIKTLAEWAFSLGVASATLEARLDQHGWSVKNTLTIPSDRRNRGIGTRSRRQHDRLK